MFHSTFYSFVAARVSAAETATSARRGWGSGRALPLLHESRAAVSPRRTEKPTRSSMQIDDYKRRVVALFKSSMLKNSCATSEQWDEMANAVLDASEDTRVSTKAIDRRILTGKEFEEYYTEKD